MAGATPPAASGRVRRGSRGEPATDAPEPAPPSAHWGAPGMQIKRERAGSSAPPFPVVVVHGKIKKNEGPSEVERARESSIDYSLISFKQYRLAGVPGDEESAALLGCLLRVRLLFADTGEVAAAEGAGGRSTLALAAYPPGAKRSGVPCPELFVRMGAAGLTDERFGCLTTSYLCNKRPFLLEVTVAGTGRPVASFRVEILSHKTWAALHRDKRPRAGYAPSATSDDSPGSNAELDSPPPGPSTSAPSLARSLARPATPPSPTDRSGGDALADAFSQLFPFKEPPDPQEEDDRPSSALGATVSTLPPEGLEEGAGPAGLDPGDKKAAADAFIRAVEEDLRKINVASAAPELPVPSSAALAGLSPWQLPQSPPYRHAGEAEREAAVALVAAAGAAVRAAAAAAGVRHPVRAGQSVPPPRRCLALRGRPPHQILSSATVFDTPLFSTQEGRHRLRRILEDLRLCGSSWLVDSVLGAWLRCLTNVPPASPSEDARLMAEHIWRMLETIAGHAQAIAVDLLPISRAQLTGLVDFAARLALPTRPARPAAPPRSAAEPDGSGAGGQDADPVFFARSLMKRGWGCMADEQYEAAMELYFEAWSTLIRTQNTPSRAELDLFIHMNYIVLMLPNRRDLAAHLCSKVYWFVDDYDPWYEAAAFRALGQEAFFRRDWKVARRHLLRAVELLEPMPDGYRVITQNPYLLLGQCCFHRADFRGVLNYVRHTNAVVSALQRLSFHELDIAAQFLSLLGPVYEPRLGSSGRAEAPDGNFNASPMLKTLRWFGSIVEHIHRGSEMRHVLTGHIAYHLGAVHLVAGEYGKALGHLERALALTHGRFPAYFPAHLARVAKLHEAVDHCRRALAAGSLGRPAPSPRVHPEESPRRPDKASPEPKEGASGRWAAKRALAQT
eukprot:tig00001443_g8750.t1